MEARQPPDGSMALEGTEAHLLGLGKELLLELGGVASVKGDIHEGAIAHLGMPLVVPV